jgi:hypothetical protein
MFKGRKHIDLENKELRAAFFKERGDESKRPAFEKLTQAFLEDVKDRAHVLKIELRGSMTTDYEYPKDLDIAVYIDDPAGIAPVSHAQRHTTHVTLGLDIWVFDAGGNFLGHICQRGPKNCPTSSVECGMPGCGQPKTLKKRDGFVFDRELFFKTPGKVLWERK